MRPIVEFCDSELFRTMPENTRLTLGSPMARKPLTKGDFAAIVSAYETAANPPIFALRSATTKQIFALMESADSIVMATVAEGEDPNMQAEYGMVPDGVELPEPEPCVEVFKRAVAAVEAVADRMEWKPVKPLAEVLLDDPR